MDEESAKRLQFNRYFEEQLFQKWAEAQKKIWFISGSFSYGYDNNVAIDSKRKSDWFYEAAVDGSIIVDHTGVGDLWGPGSWGVKASFDHREYDERNAFDHNLTSVAPFLEVSLWEALKFKSTYYLDLLRFIHDNQLDAVTHGTSAELTHSIFDHLSQHAGFTYSFKHYRDRLMLSSDGGRLDKNREDRDHGVSYGIRFAPADPTLLGASGTWHFNESNDVFVNFNDYKGYKINAFVSHEWNDRILWIVTGGYDYRDYNGRVFATESSVTEHDHYFYLGSRTFLDVTEFMQIGFTYLYGQNNSNDPSQEYSLSVFKLGVYFDI